MLPQSVLNHWTSVLNHWTSVFKFNTLLSGLTLQVLVRRSLNCCSCTTWFLDLDDLVRINRVWLYKEPKVSVLQTNAKLVQKGKCWTWNQRFSGSILTGVIFCYWNFLFWCNKASDANISIIAILVHFGKTLVWIPKVCNSTFDIFRTRNVWDSSYSHLTIKLINLYNP